MLLFRGFGDEKKYIKDESLADIATLNVLALTYPINLLIHAESTGGHLFAAFALVGLVFLLAVIDAVSIVVADVDRRQNL